VIIETDRAALVFIEFQREWLDDDGKLFTAFVKDRSAFRRAQQNAGAVLAAARRAGWNIAHAGLDLRHDPTYRVFAGGEGVLGLRRAIPAAGTWAGESAEFVPPFVPGPGEFLVRGRTGASALKNSTLDAYLRNNRIDTVLLCGFATHICVESTLREAHDSGINALLVTDACAAFTEAQQAYVVEHVLHHYGEGIDSEALLAVIAESAVIP
jgi:nicotinamidase-related amidase